MKNNDRSSEVAAVQLEATQQGQEAVHQTFTRYRPQDVLPSIAIHQQLLQRPREKEGVPSPSDSEADRFYDIRD
jgi:hypothetical protein